jgi:hypothetical protein
MIEYRLSGHVRSYAAIPRGGVPVAVNGRQVISICEGCGKAILEGAWYLTWADGIETCKKCSPPSTRGVRGEIGRRRRSDGS